MLNALSGYQAIQSQKQTLFKPKPLLTYTLPRQTFKTDTVHFGLHTTTNKPNNIPVFTYDDLKQLKAQLEQATSQKVRIEIGTKFINAFNKHGAILIRNTNAIEKEKMKKIWGDLTTALGQPLAELRQYNTPQINTFRGLQLKPNDPKRVFSVGTTNNVVLKNYENLTTNGLELKDQLQGIKKELIDLFGLIYEGKTDGYFNTQVNSEKVKNTELLRQIYYPNKTQLNHDGITITQKVEDNSVRLKAHLDYGLITILPAAGKSGLYILPNSIGKDITSEEAALQVPLEKWIKVKTQPNDILVQIGRQGALTTQSFQNIPPLSATWHMVLANEDELSQSRPSAALFVEALDSPTYDIQKSITNKEPTVAKCTIGDKTVDAESLFEIILQKWEEEGNEKLYKEEGRKKTVEDLKAFETEADLEQLLKNNNFVSVYQPQQNGKEPYKGRHFSAFA